MKEAQKFLAKGQVDKAIAEWDKLVRESPDGNIHNIIGDLYYRKGDKKSAVDSYHKSASFFRHEGFSLKALALYKKLLNINPSDIDALYALGQLSEEKGLTTDATRYYLAAADGMSKEGDKDRLLEIYKKILSLSPSNTSLRQKVAEIFLKEGLISSGLDEYVHLARIYEERGETAKAREFYRKVLDLQPAKREAIMGLGDLYEKEGALEKAVHHMKEATALLPDDTGILFRHAEIALADGDDASARESLYRIIEIEPGNIKPRKLLGDIYMKEGLNDKAWLEYLPVIDQFMIEERYVDALSLLQPFKGIEPMEVGRRLVSLYRHLGENVHVSSELASLGDAFRERGMEDDALQCYREALELSPDDDRLKGLISGLTEQPEIPPAPEKEAVTVQIPGDKTAEEILNEADIFSRYGLAAEALKLLEGLKVRDPKNIDVHAKLKSLYISMSDKESAVTECLVLHELYKRVNDPGNSEAMLKEAFELFPEDPRLVDRRPQPSVAAGEQPVAESSVTAESAPSIEDYEEDIAEADFYARQGLTVEAEKILKKLQALFPGNADIGERLENLGQIQEVREPPAVSRVFEEEADGEAEVIDARMPEEEAGEGSPELPQEEQLEDLGSFENEIAEAQEMPEPALDNDVLEIFQEFKKGIEREVGEEDSETHYNIGIAYKEMGLLDDAITEFQVSRNDPKRFVQSSTMLGICYMEKGLYPLAIEALGRVLKEVDDKEETYWAVKYDLAEAHEKNNDLKEALALYTDVYGWNARFRGVSEKVSLVKTQLSRSTEKEKPKEKKDRVSYL